ncbi:Uncharacterized protein APZ42_007737 [Daphnia magna]|uniref:Uncharacterized protein n=1 Tax=Daphnia magna TaxID=35525 RepID=A0A164F4A3_9CRUS|nr:Uncharacterized protein APZ42_007737 [Daphnia magna]
MEDIRDNVKRSQNCRLLGLFWAVRLLFPWTNFGALARGADYLDQS